MPDLLIAITDPALQSFACDNLTADGYRVTTPDPDSDRDTFQQHLAAHAETFAGVVADGDLLVGPALAQLAPRVPILGLAPSTDELAIVRLFQQGAQDVLRTPFAYQELYWRVRRLTGPKTRVSRIEAEGLTVGLDERRAYVNDRSLELTAIEFKLLAVLATAPTRCFPKDELLRTVWSARSLGYSRTLDSHACRLRRKLTDADPSRIWMQNVWGVGYRLMLPVQEPEATSVREAIA